MADSGHIELKMVKSRLSDFAKIWYASLRSRPRDQKPK